MGETSPDMQGQGGKADEKAFGKQKIKTTQINKEGIIDGHNQDQKKEGETEQVGVEASFLRQSILTFICFIWQGFC